MGGNRRVGTGCRWLSDCCTADPVIPRKRCNRGRWRAPPSRWPTPPSECVQQVPGPWQRSTAGELGPGIACFSHTAMLIAGNAAPEAIIPRCTSAWQGHFQWTRTTAWKPCMTLTTRAGTSR